jgi:anaerobic selenocysteine-containing dehydrogenase
MHAALCIAAVTGAWQHEGGGAFHSNSGIFHLHTGLIEGLDQADASIRKLEQSAIGRVLTGDAFALRGGPPVKALLIQNTNPVSVCPEQTLVKQGFTREDLFVAVHEQFMTETAKYADVLMPATMFLEHDDFYTGGGHQHIMLGGKLIEPPGECWPNHDVICALATRLGATHRGFEMTPRAIIDETLQKSGWGTLAQLETDKWIDCQPSFDAAHYLNGFAYRDGKFRFKPDWQKVPFAKDGMMGPWQDMPTLPDHWAVTEEADAAYPFRLATSPSRSYLNSSFTETPGSQKREGVPALMMHPDDGARLGLAEGSDVLIGSPRGETVLALRFFAGVQLGVVISEGIHPNGAHKGGRGINTLTDASQVAPFGGAPFHDNKVWVRAV